MSVLPLQRQKGMECIDAFSMYDMPAVSLVTGKRPFRSSPVFHLGEWAKREQSREDYQ